MPNWCDNEVIITGDKATLDAILESSRYSDNPFSMEAFLRTPPQVLENKSGISEDKNAILQALGGNTNYDYDNWYEWRIANWGCKWDMSEMKIDRTERSIFLTYLTPWSPNNQFWNYFSKKFPTLTITHHYLEEGMNFIGEAEYQNGINNDTCVDISSEMLRKLNVELDADGYPVEDSEYSLWDLFPLSNTLAEIEKEKVNG